MPASMWPERVAVLHGGPQDSPGGLGTAFAYGFRQNGCAVELWNREERWTRPPDLVLGYGPSSWEGSLLPVARQLAEYPAGQRPFFYWWFIECIPDPRLPAVLARYGAKLRVALHHRTAGTAEARGMLRAPGLSGLFLRGFRLQILGELFHFQSHGLLNGLAVTSPARCKYLQLHGFRPIVVPIGYDPELHGSHLGLQRDIEVGFIGNVDTRRRSRLLERVRGDLEERGIDISVQTNLYGEDRTRFLNRTKVILNIFRAPYDFHGLRFLFCAANKALLVSEPLADNQPFLPGRHLIAEPVEELADTIEYYLAHGAQRQELVEEAYRLVHDEYTIEQMVRRILDDAREIRSMH